MNIKALALTALVAISPAAFADHDHRDKRYDRGNHHSKHYNKHYNKGEAINRKLDRKAAKAARYGNYEKAARLDRKGDRIERRYNNAYKNHGYQGHYYNGRHYAKHHYKHRNKHHAKHYNKHYDNQPRVSIFLPNVSIRW